MNKRHTLAAGALAAFLLAGCDQKAKETAARVDTTPAPVTVPTAPPTLPVTLELASQHVASPPPTTQPAQPPHSTFAVADGITPVPARCEFPLARLHIDREQKTAVLYSDDPKTAINRDYAGNSYYFVIPLSDDALEHLDHYQWHFKAAGSEHDAAADGLFLEGQRFHVQPSEMVVAFEGDGPTLRVGLDGNFNRFDMSRNGGEGQMVRVNGTVTATIDIPKK